MAIIHVDGKTYEVDGADNLLQACLSLGLDVPYFCWHPALGSVGSCRQCAVKHYRDENDKMGRMVMSCMTPAADNTYISIADDEAREFRAAMISFVMTNHPHDCPVCEEGGHCHLQDMTVMSGHHNRSYRFTKRTHRNQELGPFIAHEMNRCIACYRCVRFYKDYAGGTDLGVFGSASRVYFGRETDGTLESEFSGNLTEVCPTGVFTDKTHSEHYTRKWDMQFAPGICSGCAVGCNISPGERYGEVRRIENRYNGEVNGYFLCDRGRFGYGHVNRADRPRQALQRLAGVLTPSAAAFDAALAAVASGKPVIGIGSTRASIEGNHALRQLVGAEHFYVASAAAEWALTELCLQVSSEGAVPVASIREIDDADAALVLGEDLMATAARMALALRQTARGLARSMSSELKVPEWQAYSSQDIAQRQLNPVFVVTPAATRFDDIARETLRATPATIARLGYAVARAIDPAAPAVNDLSAAEQALAGRIADALMSAKRPVVVSGCGSGSPEVIRAAANVARALYARNASTRMALVPPDANSLGMAMMRPQALDAALQRAAQTPSVLIVLEADLFRQAPAAQVDAALAQSTLIVVDQQMTATAQRAEVVLPAASFAEGDGTLVNYEGRAQRHFQSFDPAFYDAKVQTAEAWRWLNRLSSGRGGVAIESLDAMLADVARQQPQLAGVVDAAPGADFRVDGMRLARSPHRSSGRTSMRANVFVHEPRASQDADTALNFSMEGHNGTQAGDRPGALIPFAWSPGWNSPQAWNKFQDEVGGHLVGGDPGVLLLGSGSDRGYFAAPTARSADTVLRVQPLRHIFGSEELSALAEPIQQRIPAPYAMLSLGDAQALGVEHDALLKVSVSGVELKLPARVRIDFPAGLVGLPVGLAGMPALTAQATVTVAKAS